MLIPLAFYFKKYIYVGLMCVALILANSQVAWIALILAMVFYLCMIRPRITPVAITIILLVYIGGSLYITSRSAYKELMNDNGRFPVWKMTMSDIKSGALNEMKADYSMTGLGPGAFGHVFPFAHKSVFKQAHNDYLEFWYNNGFLGIGSLLLAMIMMFKIAWGKFIKYADYRKTRIAALLSSFIVIAICAFGTFVWQLGAHIFYTCVLVGLIHNETI
jgi:O-antigen ligase